MRATSERLTAPIGVWLDRSRPTTPAHTGRIPALDGIRGLALVAVLVYHARSSVLPGGFLGVEMFFVLSGFLLTTLLLDEHVRTGAIDRRAYAMRRVRRIVPALIVLLTALAVIGFFIAPEDAHRLGRDIVASLLGLTNWHLIRDGTSYFAQTGRPPLVRHLWSIAVEVQAYVVVPFIAGWVALRSHKTAIRTLAAGTALSATLMGILARTSGTTRAYFGTDTRIGAIITGALIAVLLSERRETHRPHLSRGAITLMAGAGAVVLVVLFFVTNENSGFLYPAGFLTAQAATGTLLLAGTRPGPAARMLTWSPLRWLGTRSYGIYLWHWPIVALIRPGVDVGWSPLESAVVSIGAALVLGALSYRFVERPFMDEKTPALSRKTVRIGGLAWACVMSALVVVLVQTAPVDPIAASLAAGERTLAAQNAPQESAAPNTNRPPGFGNDPVPAIIPAPAAGPFRPGAAATPPPKAPATSSVKITALGDSVMLGAAPRMKARFGKDSYINAVKNRQWREGVTAVHVFRQQGNLGRVLIVHLGNNGPAKGSDIDAIMNEVKGICDHVLLVTVRVPKPWQDEVNTTLKDAAKRYTTIVIVNWYRESEGHRDWFYSDGTHLDSGGRDAYTNLLVRSVPPPPKPKPTPKPTPTPSPTPGLLRRLGPHP